jgi:tetratricopeptide (TPR) repeat protein
VTGAFDRLGDLLDPVGQILARIWPPVLAVIATVALLRTVRWLVLLWHGRTPRVQISTFAWASSDGAERESTWVTSLFREQLAALRLDALDPLPERAPGAQLVQIVEGVGQGVSRDVGAAAGRLFRAIWPDSAYEVWGTLRPREGGGGRISVQLIERRRGNRTLLSVALEDASWEEGAREAALAVAGALYPEVREGERGPWTLWPRSVPRQLMYDYHSARKFEESNQLEHALDAYHSALERDPLNPNLRLKIAMLQERMELYLDAWVTYGAIVDEKDSRAWRGPDRRVYLLALYRLAVMLSNGCVAAQWVKQAAITDGEGFLRDREREELRRDLMLSLEADPTFEKHTIKHSCNELLVERAPRTISSRIKKASADGLMGVLRWLDHDVNEMGDALRPFIEVGESERERARKIEPVLQILGLRRLEELETALRRIPPSRNWRAGWMRRASVMDMLTKRPEFGRGAVRTSQLLVRTRIAASLESIVRRRAAGPGGFPERDRWIKEIREGHRELTKRWPFPPANIRRRILHWLAPRRRWENRREDAWQLHYNAACTTASILREESVVDNFVGEQAWVYPGKLPRALRPLPKEVNSNAVARAAILELEEYAYRAGSARVAAQADWVAIDDPDLSGLRRTPEFALWASHHLPLEIPRGKASRRADVKRFTIRVVHQGARAFAASWRQRAGEVEPTAAELVAWWRTEAEVWQALGNACREHLSWKERLKWLQTLQTWLRETEKEDAVDFSYETRGAAANTMSENLFEELAALAGVGVSANGSDGDNDPDCTCALPWVDQRANQVRDAHEVGEERADSEGILRLKEEREEALRAARAWTRLAEILELQLAGGFEGDRGEKLRRQMLKIRGEFAAVSNGEPPISALGRPVDLLRLVRSHLNERGRSQAPPRPGR